VANDGAGFLFLNNGQIFLWQRCERSVGICGGLLTVREGIPRKVDKPPALSRTSVLQPSSAKKGLLIRNSSLWDSIGGHEVLGLLHSEFKGRGDGSAAQSHSGK